MQNPTATLHCPNPSCQTLNPEGNQFCLKCGSFLPKHYLWSLADGKIDRARSPKLLNDRYLWKTERILLDTRPGLLPETPEDVPPHIAPYLKLFAYRIHVPQVYGRISRSSQTAHPDIWLLEQAPICVEGSEKNDVCLQPALTEAWSSASPMRQLNWLWQIANLWSPLLQVGVASSLLDPQWVRVEGATVRLLELAEDVQTPTLKQLGQFWSRWIGGTAVPMRDFLHRLCGLLTEGQVHSAEHLVTLLDRGLAVVGREWGRRIEVRTLSDKGPSRTRNEDACYPPSGTTGKVTPETLTIVCDGVGGHEGGDVASRIAIEAISGHLQPFLHPRDGVSFDTLSSALETSIYEANNAISAQNNQEKRQGRQRMGTTVAIGLTHAHELYITHVGDSRAYRITSKGCRQLTLDDDVASREVRLGYAFYRNALQQVAAGSLVQALGMGSSNTLYPNINRTIVDEDCLFLFCSDGLSDYDRVEQYWADELLPVLEGKIELGEAARKLVSIANTLNGHDNVTVALIRIQVAPADAKSISPSLLLDQLDSLPISRSQTQPPVNIASSDSSESEDLPTQVIVRQSPSRAASILPMAIALLTAGLALAGAGYFAYLRQPVVRKWVDDRLGREIAASPSPSVSVPSDAVLALDGQVPIRIQTGTQLWKVPGERTEGFEEVPAETILQVVNQQEIEENLWLELRVCQRSSTAASPTPEGTTPEAAIETTKPSSSPEAKDNKPQETPTPKAEPKAEEADRTKATSSASPTPKSDEKKGETETADPSNSSPSNNDDKDSEEAETLESETFWIIAAELDRIGFEMLESDGSQSESVSSESVPSDTCQPPAPPSTVTSEEELLPNPEIE